MAMVGVVSGSLYRRTESSGLVLSRRPLDAILHSSNELGELLQWLCHVDSTINIVFIIIIIIVSFLVTLLLRKVDYLTEGFIDIYMIFPN